MEICFVTISHSSSHVEKLSLVLDSYAPEIPFFILENGESQFDSLLNSRHRQIKSDNQGFGSAFNKILRIVRRQGFRYMVFVSHDSTPLESSIRKIQANYKEMSANFGIQKGSTSDDYSDGWVLDLIFGRTKKSCTGNSMGLRRNARYFFYPNYSFFVLDIRKHGDSMKMDENYFLYWEDVDLHYHYMCMHSDFQIDDELKFDHSESIDIKGNSLVQDYYFTKSQIRFLYKNLKWSYFRVILFCLIPKISLRILTGRWTSAGNILSAMLRPW